MDLNIGFENNTTETKITYVVAHYLRYRKKWHPICEYENIEKAKEKKEQIEKTHVCYKCGIFEHIESETINQICV